MRCDAKSRRQDNVAPGTNARQQKRKWRVENGRMRVRMNNQGNERRKEKKKKKTLRRTHTTKKGPNRKC